MKDYEFVSISILFFCFENRINIKDIKDKKMYIYIYNALLIYSIFLK